MDRRRSARSTSSRWRPSSPACTRRRCASTSARGSSSPRRTEGRSRRYSDRDIALLRRIQELTNEGVEPRRRPQDPRARGPPRGRCSSSCSGCAKRRPPRSSASGGSTAATWCRCPGAGWAEPLGRRRRPRRPRRLRRRAARRRVRRGAAPRGRAPRAAACGTCGCRAPRPYVGVGARPSRCGASRRGARARRSRCPAPTLAMTSAESERRIDASPSRIMNSASPGSPSMHEIGARGQLGGLGVPGDGAALARRAPREQRHRLEHVGEFAFGSHGPCSCVVPRADGLPYRRPSACRPGVRGKGCANSRSSSCVTAGWSWPSPCSRSSCRASSARGVHDRLSLGGFEDPSSESNRAREEVAKAFPQASLSTSCSW